MQTLKEKLIERSSALKEQLTAVYYAWRHPRTGFIPKALFALTLAYALSPIDLIPDFIPVIGYLDDLIIIPALIAISLKLIPPDVWEECKLKAKNKPVRLKKNWHLPGSSF